MTMYLPAEFGILGVDALLGFRWQSLSTLLSSQPSPQQVPRQNQNLLLTLQLRPQGLSGPPGRGLDHLQEHLQDRPEDQVSDGG